MSLAAGRLRHRVRIEKLQLIRDSAGDVIHDPLTGETSTRWEKVCTVWAAIEPLSAREFIRSQSVQSQVTARIVIRHRHDLDPGMRLVHLRDGRDNVIYNPAAFLEDPESGMEYITIPCSRGLSDGR